MCIINSTPTDIDPHSNTPVEILHVLLLGFIKYFWRDAMEHLSDTQKETVKIRLSCVDVSGLGPDIASLRGATLVQYAGSLVGRDFWILIQVALFVLYDLLDKKILGAWAALAVLVPLVWQPEINNVDDYLVSTRNTTNKPPLISLFRIGLRRLYSNSYCAPLTGLHAGLINQNSIFFCT